MPDRMKEIADISADDAVGKFSRDVLWYDRTNPRPGQKLPGELLEELEDEQERRKARRKGIGRIIWAVIAFFAAAAGSTCWSLITKHFGVG